MTQEEIRTPEQAQKAVDAARDLVVGEGGGIHEDAIWDACDMAMDGAPIRSLAERIKQERAEKYKPTGGWGQGYRTMFGVKP